MQFEDPRPVAEDTAKHPPGLIPRAQWNRYYDWPSYPTLVELIRQRDDNGFADAIVKFGGEWLIDPGVFWTIVRRQAGVL